MPVVDGNQHRLVVDDRRVELTEFEDLGRTVSEANDRLHPVPATSTPTTARLRLAARDRR